jgi:hypothetical protein
MRRIINIAGLLLGAVLVLALSGLAVSSASAVPRGLCWKVEFSETGNYSKYCLKKEPNLDGFYVLAELVEKQGVNLYCAKIDNAEPTGSSEGAKCEKLVGSTGLMTTVLFGLAVFLLLTGGKLPVELKAENTTATTKLVTKLGELSGVGFLARLDWTNLSTSSLGPASLLFTKVKEKTVECSTGADASGVILIDDAVVHLVYLLLDPLFTIFMILIPSFKITCGAVKETVRGSSATTRVPLEEWEEKGTGSFETVSGCLANGKPDVTKYWNEEGEEVTVKLEAELNGLGKIEEGCESISEPIKLIPTEMLEISEP